MPLRANRVGPHPVLSLFLSVAVVFCSLGGSLFFSLCWVLRKAAAQPSMFNSVEEYVYVVPGKQLVNDLPDEEFKNRLNHCWLLWQKNPAPIYLLGGNRGAADATEAEVARDWLLGCGVPLSQLILEQRSQHSLENLVALQSLVSGEVVLAIVSNRYHLPRLSLMAGTLSMRVLLVAAEPVLKCAPVTWLRWIKEAFYIHWFYIARNLY